MSSQRSVGGFFKAYGPPIFAFGVFIGVWYAVHYWILSENRKFIVPPPHAVIDNAFLDDIARSSPRVSHCSAQC
jgi:NitT/TauT family transport system permease protein